MFSVQRTRCFSRRQRLPQCYLYASSSARHVTFCLSAPCTSTLNYLLTLLVAVVRSRMHWRIHAWADRAAASMDQNRVFLFKYLTFDPFLYENRRKAFSFSPGPHQGLCPSIPLPQAPVIGSRSTPSPRSSSFGKSWMRPCPNASRYAGENCAFWLSPIEHSLKVEGNNNRFFKNVYFMIR